MRVGRRLDRSGCQARKHSPHRMGKECPEQVVFVLCAPEPGRVQCPLFRVSETAEPTPEHPKGWTPNGEVHGEGARQGG